MSRKTNKQTYNIQQQQQVEKSCGWEKTQTLLSFWAVELQEEGSVPESLDSTRRSRVWLMCIRKKIFFLIFFSGPAHNVARWQEAIKRQETMERDSIWKTPKLKQQFRATKASVERQQEAQSDWILKKNYSLNISSQCCSRKWKSMGNWNWKMFLRLICIFITCFIAIYFYHHCHGRRGGGDPSHVCVKSPQKEFLSKLDMCCPTVFSRL